MPSKKQPQTIGSRLRHFRTVELSDMSQHRFAQSVDIDHSYYSKIEKDQAGLAPDKAENIANVYHVNLNWLYLGKGDVYQDNELGVAEATRAFVANMFTRVKKATPADLKEASDIIGLLDKYILAKQAKAKKNSKA